MNERFNQFSEIITKINKHFQQIKELEMEHIGLKASHVTVFLELYRQKDGVTSAQLSRACQLDKAAISRILPELEEKDMIFIDCDKTRKKYAAKVMLSEKGKACVEKITQIIDENVEEASLQISQEERDIFYRNLNQIAKQLEYLHEKKRNKK